MTFYTALYDHAGIGFKDLIFRERVRERESDTRLNFESQPDSLSITLLEPLQIKEISS